MNEPTIRKNVPTRQHPFELLIAQTALLVIDMQVDFCDRSGFCSVNLEADISAIQTMIPRLQRVIRWARSQGIWIICTRESHKPDLSDLTPSKQLRYIDARYPASSMGNRGRFLVQGEAGTEIISKLAPEAKGWRLDKPAQSVFIETSLVVSQIIIDRLEDSENRSLIRPLKLCSPSFFN